MANHERFRIRNFLICAGALASFLKIYLALTTLGMSDTIHWLDFVHVTREQGGLALYYKPYSRWTFFNHPPFMVHMAHFYGWLASVTHISLAFWVRLPSILADVGTLFVLWRLTNLQTSAYSRIAPAMLFFVALSPISILVFGFHGNTDAVMMFWLVLSFYFLQREKPLWLVGITFGMSLNTKIVPLMFVPVLLLFLREPRRQFEYLIAVIATWVIGGMPYLAQDPTFIVGRIFGYSGQYNNWGLGRLLDLMPPEFQFLNATFEHGGKYLLLVLITALSWWMNRHRRTEAAKNRTALELQCATVVAVFLSLTPAFGYQYLAWIVPFLPLWNGRPVAFFTVFSTLYLLAVYTFRWRTWSWYADTPWLINYWKEHIVILETLAWSTVLVLFYFMMKKVALEQTRLRADATQIEERVLA